MTDSKRPGEAGDSTEGQGGVQVIRRKIRKLTGDGGDIVSASTPTLAPTENVAVQGNQAQPTTAGSHVLSLEGFADDEGDGHTMYATASTRPLAPTATVTVDANNDVPSTTTSLTVEPTAEVGVKGNGAPLVQRLFTTEVKLRPATPEEAKGVALTALHKYAVSIAEYCAQFYVSSTGRTMPSADLCLADKRHVNLTTSGGRKLSAQVRIKPFGNRIEVAFRLMERRDRPGTFYPTQNDPVCFSFPRDVNDKLIMVAGDTTPVWFVLALQKFAEKLSEDAAIVLDAKVRA